MKLMYCAYCNGKIIGGAGVDKVNDDIWEVVYDENYVYKDLIKESR